MRRRRAFTLVELLVVVGIITVLIAILLPVLGRARELAYRVKCAANLRSIGHAMTMYVEQYRYYPCDQVWTSDYRVAIWPSRLRRFVGGREVFWCPAREEEARWTDTGPGPVARASARWIDFGYEEGEPIINDLTPFSYGYNVTGATGDDWVATQKGLGAWPMMEGIYNDDRFGEMRATRIRLPADMIAVADSDTGGVAINGLVWRQNFSVRPRRSDNTLPGRLHNGGANVLFCDGHVAWYLQEDLIVGEPRTEADKPRIRMWNNDHLAPGDNPVPFVPPHPPPRP